MDELLGKLSSELAFKGTMSELNLDPFAESAEPTVSPVEGYVSSGKWYSKIGTSKLYYLKGEDGFAYAPRLNFDNTLDLEPVEDFEGKTPFAHESPFGALSTDALAFDEESKVLTVNVPVGLSPSFGRSFLANENIAPTAVAVSFDEDYEPAEMTWTIPTIVVIDPAWGLEYQYEYTFEASFVSPSEIALPADAPLPSLEGQAELEAALGELAKGNYRLLYEDAAQGVSAEIISSPSFYDVRLSKESGESHGGYYFPEEGMASPYEVLDGIPTGTSAPEEGTLASLTGASFDLASEFFVPEGEGTFLLRDEGKDFVSRIYPANFVSAALEREGIYTLDGLLNGTFAVAIGEGTLSFSFDYEYEQLTPDFTYETVKGTVEIAVSGFGTTEDPYEKEAFVPYESPDTWLELGGEALVSALAACLGDPNILPLPDTSSMSSFTYDDFFSLTLYFVYPSAGALGEAMASYGEALLASGWVAGEGSAWQGTPYTYGSGDEAKTVTISEDAFADEPTMSLAIGSSSGFSF